MDTSISPPAALPEKGRDSPASSRSPRIGSASPTTPRPPRSSSPRGRMPDGNTRSRTAHTKPFGGRSGWGRGPSSCHFSTPSKTPSTPPSGTYTARPYGIQPLDGEVRGDDGPSPCARKRGDDCRRCERCRREERGMTEPDNAVASNSIYDTYRAEYVAIVQAAEDIIVAVLSVTPVHRLYLPATLLAYQPGSAANVGDRECEHASGPGSCDHS